MSSSCDASIDGISNETYDQRLCQEDLMRDWHQSPSTSCLSQSDASSYRCNSHRLARPAYEPAIHYSNTLELHIPDPCWCLSTTHDITRDLSGPGLEYSGSPFGVLDTYPTWLPELASSDLRPSAWEFENSANDLVTPVSIQEADYLSDRSELPFVGSFAQDLYPLAEDPLNDLSPVSSMSYRSCTGASCAISSDPSEMTIQSLGDSAMIRGLLRQDMSSSHNGTSTWSGIDANLNCVSEREYMSPIQERGSSEHDAHIRAPEDIPCPASPGQRKRFGCTQSGCTTEFRHNADLSRHLKTIHSKAGRGYRCAYDGCSKAYKVWTRLDSFKMHAKQHGPKDVEDLVRNSRREHQGLPVSVTTPNMMFHRGAARSRSRLSTATSRGTRTV